ncbi:MAG: class I SAM-dependent methyltransferase [Methylotenera sp.]|uniref:class I SAM-dependent methyltransferase n=1 Tax=Methylotenera sp. TaxID=2051956 RepID=UPI002489F812|nr:class I SAM-dependent methyltransferase [Methylotenera sp.]MDI1308025.1 class I SAM-dependent methyltransferase [Methylotenera sp.]
MKFESKSTFGSYFYKKSFLKSALNKLPTLRPNKRLVPATLAVLIQCAALLSVAITTWTVIFASAYFGLSLNISIFTLVLMQALAAATLSYLAGMASWWRWIHLCFPLAAWLLYQWHIPNVIYLVGFIISLSLFWTTFRTQVPFFPSRPVVWHQVASIIPQESPVRLIDIGSGLGDMSMYMAKTRPDSQIEGIEIAPLPWMISYIRAKFRRSSAKFILGNYQALDFAKYDVIFAYLSPAAMRLLWDKASKEMRSGTLLISLEFEIPDVPETTRIPSNKNTPEIYVWQIP